MELRAERPEQYVLNLYLRRKSGPQLMASGLTARSMSSLLSSSKATEIWIEEFI